MKAEVKAFHEAQSAEEREICDLLYEEIRRAMPDAEYKIWHRHPVWFLDENPIVGYSKLKGCIRLFFWSGMGFEEDQLEPGTGKFKDASIRYTNVDQVSKKDLARWLEKASRIQWDYKNIRKRKGKLKRIQP